VKQEGHRLRLVIVDDHDIVRVGLQTAIGKRYPVVGAAATGAEALTLVTRALPYVAIVDLRLPDMRGEDVCRQILEVAPKTAVVILSTYQSEENVRSALAAGAAGYVTKAAGLPELMRVLSRLEAGETPNPGECAQQTASRLRVLSEAQHDGVVLTPQQESILELAAQGNTNQEISGRLYISESTVRFHLQKLKKKLGARSKTDLIARAIRMGLISPALEDSLFV
jgi:DNA-binding NarL/FixJ family response regulator